ncbi:HTH-type transcriptional regulator AcrR [compost metagenome]|uniref:TetR family transcriptional regulator n=1 Tax=Paenibacillus stellifer TaxID=169760 RepID=UPI000690D59D|nr:TetR family transcriptional regulator [Paenibacillus stellifer]
MINRPERSRLRIYNAIQALTASKNPEDITLSDIARVSGLSWPTIRRHVGGREAVKSIARDGFRFMESEVPDTRTRILQAASNVFSKHGYSGTSLEHIAAEVGMTKGAVYSNFKNKSELYLTLLEQNIHARVLELPDSIWKHLKETTPEESVVLFFQSQVVHRLGDQEGNRLFFDFVSNARDPSVQNQLSTLYRGGYKQIQKLIENLQHEQIISREYNAFELSVFFVAILDGLMISWLVDPEGIDMDNLAQAFARIVWNGLQRYNKEE